MHDIINEIVKGAVKIKAKELEASRYSSTVYGNKKQIYFRIPERGEAIAFAINVIAKKGDTVVVCGKGHEKSMAYNGVEHPWSDQQEIENALNSDLNKVAILLAAGKGKRMNSDYPKVIHKIAGRPMISYSLDNLRKAGFGRKIIIVGFKKELVIKEAAGVTEFATQHKRLGTGHAAFQGLKLINEGDLEDVVVMNGDDSAFYYPETINRILSAHKKSRAVVTFVSLVKENPFGLGRVIRDGRGRLLGIVEEKDTTVEEKKITEVNDGLYILDVAWAKRNLPNCQKKAAGEYLIVDLIKITLDEEKHVEVYKLKNSEEWVGVNTPDELKAADDEKRKQL